MTGHLAGVLSILLVRLPGKRKYNLVRVIQIARYWPANVQYRLQIAEN